MRDNNQAFRKATAPRKAWSYKRLTEATEAQIHSHAAFLKDFLERHPDHRLNDVTVTQVSGWAYGAFLLWQRVAQGWQLPEDEQRLRALAESVENVGKDRGSAA